MGVNCTNKKTHAPFTQGTYVLIVQTPYFTNEGSS